MSLQGDTGDTWTIQRGDEATSGMPCPAGERALQAYVCVCACWDENERQAVGYTTCWEKAQVKPVVRGEPLAAGLLRVM